MQEYYFLTPSQMSNSRTNYPAEFKFKVGMLALSETMTISEVASQYEVHPVQVSNWKKELQEHGKEVFENKRKHDSAKADQEKQIERLYKQIGQLTVENDWLKKKSSHLSIRF